MTISYISAATNAGDTVTIGTHAAGDTIIMSAYNDGATTVPSLPTGWIGFSTLSGSLTGWRMAYKVATTSSETSGTWTNADGLIALVYRPNTSGNVLVPGIGAGNSGTTATINYPAIAAANDRTNADQWMIGLAVQRSDTNALETAPTGMTNRSVLTGTGWESVAHDTNANAASWTSTNVTVATSAFYRSLVFQLFEQPFYSAGAGGMFFRPGMCGGFAE